MSTTIISTAADLASFMGNPFLWGNQVTIVAPLNMQAHACTPIGNSVTPFTGTFYGQNLAISNVHIQETDADDVGFFGRCVGATVQNVVLENTIVSVTYSGAIGNRVGALIGNSNSTAVKDCGVRGATSVSGRNEVGGFIGYAIGGSVNNSYLKNSVTLSANGNNSSGFIGDHLNLTDLGHIYVDYTSLTGTSNLLTQNINSIATFNNVFVVVQGKWLKLLNSGTVNFFFSRKSVVFP
jgi:hypothetical protein